MSVENRLKRIVDEQRREIAFLRYGNAALIDALASMICQHATDMDGEVVCTNALSANERALDLLYKAGFATSNDECRDEPRVRFDLIDKVFTQRRMEAQIATEELNSINAEKETNDERHDGQQDPNDPLDFAFRQAQKGTKAESPAD